jgi:Fe-S cluster biogenesis protein NfuA/nitrite reductase/ring-hydroxylating ferredoxin subunit
MPPGMEQVESLIRRIESLPDPAARNSAIELVQALMEFHGAGLERLMEKIAERGEVSYSIFDDLAADPLVSSLLLLYGLHPIPIETRIVQALDKVRPYLDSHGGRVELLTVENGIVRLRLEGSCKSCPSSSVTLKLAIEEAIYAAAPDILSIEAEGVTEESPHNNQTGFVQIGKPPRNGKNGHAWEEIGDIALAESSLQLREVRGRSIVFCRLGQSLYAYNNQCPGCERPLHDAYLQTTSLVCAGCGSRYDLIRAGRGLDRPNLHLEPFPLLFEQGRAKVALPPS